MQEEPAPLGHHLPHDITPSHPHIHHMDLVSEKIPESSIVFVVRRYGGGVHVEAGMNHAR